MWKTPICKSSHTYQEGVVVRLNTSTCVGRLIKTATTIPTVTVAGNCMTVVVCSKLVLSTVKNTKPKTFTIGRVFIEIILARDNNVQE